MWSILEGEAESITRERHDTGVSLIYSPVMELALEWLVDLVFKQHRQVRPTVLIGSVNHFRAKDNGTLYSDQVVLETLQSLLQHGIRERVVLPSVSAYVNWFQSNFDKILLPFVLDDGHVLVVEVEYSPPGPNGQRSGIISLWDFVGAFKGCVLRYVYDVQVLSVSFFHPGQNVGASHVELVTCGHTPLSKDVLDRRPAYTGSAAYAFYVMAHRAQDKLPHGAGPEDDGFLRNYMWACIQEGKLLPLPQIKWVN